MPNHSLPRSEFAVRLSSAINVVYILHLHPECGSCGPSFDVHRDKDSSSTFDMLFPTLYELKADLVS